jgi:hypothetical protein
MATSLNSQVVSKRRSPGIRIPAWALTKRFQAASPDSIAKRTVETVPSGDEDDPLVLPDLPEMTGTGNTILLQMDMTGFAADDLHLELDLAAHRLCLSGRGPRMFKRIFPIPSAHTLDMTSLQAHVVQGLDGTRFLRVQAPRAAADTELPTGARRTIPIRDDTRPPTFIEIRG